MKITGEIINALHQTSGEAYKLICAKECARLEKQEWIKAFFKDKNASLIDVGCAGHLRNIDNQIKSGTWLHGELDSLVNINYGIDINERACIHLRENYGRSDIIAGDITKDIKRIKEFIRGGTDYILLADVIEHLENPIEFLRIIGINGYAKKIVITVPNAFHFVNLWFAVKNSEVINSDHKFWFTPFTLMKCCKEAGIIIEEIDFAGFKYKGHKLPKWICKNIMSQTICLVGKWSV